MPDWFQQIFGLSEPDYKDIQKHFLVSEITKNISQSSNLPEIQIQVNGKSWTIGPFSTPSLSQLRSRSKIPPQNKKLTFKIVKGDVQKFHIDPENNYSTFQVASQFNALEMVGPGGSPEYGITDYDSDRTQGPACCVSTAPAMREF